MDTPPLLELLSRKQGVFMDNADDKISYAFFR